VSRAVLNLLILPCPPANALIIRALLAILFDDGRAMETLSEVFSADIFRDSTFFFMTEIGQKRR
jgi:hypothetical protein